MKETLKSENFLPVIFCLCICFIGLLSGCGEKAGNESTDLSKDRYVKEGTEKSEEAKEKDKSSKISYPSTLNAKLMEMYEPIWKEYEYAQHYGTYCEEVWEEGWKQVEHIEERREQNIPKDAPRDADIVYLREGSGEEEWEYITEEKYYAIQEEYANTPMQIEWKSFADTEGNQRMKEYFEAEALSSVIQEVTEPYTELLIGEYWNDSIYRPFIIYGNIKGKISPVIIAEEYLINLYEGGIIEVIAGKAMFEDFWYYKMKKNSAETETIVNLWTDRVDIKSDDIYYADGVEISKEEFEDMRKELTNQSLEIDWQRLEGFWQGE